MEWIDAVDEHRAILLFPRVLIARGDEPTLVCEAPATFVFTKAGYYSGLTRPLLPQNQPLHLADLTVKTCLAEIVTVCPTPLATA